jgi:hypothetical protein
MNTSNKKDALTYITVRFPFTKGDGDFPDMSLFSQSEIDDIRKCLELNINLDYEFLEEYPDLQITEIEFLYDGISHNLDDDIGYWFENNELRGYPAPIIRFGLNQQISEDEFCMAVSGSEFMLKTSLMDDPFFALDENGWVHVLSNESVDECIESLKEDNLYCGKKFSIKESKESFNFPAIDFALLPKK